MEFAEFIRTPRVEKVTLYRANTPPLEGTLCVTGHHLILSRRQDDDEEELWLLHRNIDSFEKKLTGSVGTLTLKCKDFHIMHLEIPSIDDCFNVAASVEQLSNVDNINLSYPFFFRPMFDIFEDGWQAYTVESEFNRLQKYLSADWRISSLNRTFEVCSGYPHLVIVPKSVDDETIVRAAGFRQNGRFPVLSYYHKDNSMVIMRCSQPLSGPNNKRCKEDERLVNAVLGIGRRGYILDTRSPTTAKLATAKGGGVEPEAHYSQWRRIHQSMERYQILHESIIKLVEACYDVNCGMDKWLSKLDSSGWLTHVKDALTCACVAAQCVDKEGASVLVHGSEGADSTVLVTSLAQLILDPDCRTVRGLEALIEREWLHGGHPFADRCSKSAFATSRQRMESPVFLLFLDSIWQIWTQFPCSFEFNEDFLIMLFKHAYASQFGTFLCNNERDRAVYQVKDKTVSLWSYINRPEVLTKFLNALYDPNASVIWPSVAPQSLQLWTGLYQQWQKYHPVQREVWDEIVKIKETDKEAKSRVVKLRKHLVNLEREALDNGLIPAPNQVPGAHAY
ncbi:hypothetical protein CAPTEDRAFT_168491 [Capitella teleta]|uniref:Myotubularin phosphatase domain-containing protein n=1 Tax=Capitella teleta TaxID=283909 RepID=R7UM14_CAPTE|nr:hypothetical protein CAPTEDRAFT_168491 [Capitella teleta]|eukprot:ELU07118.1 hypothetical protein CAPTEDRAFT_168491 [Capitella teleta]